MPKRKFTRDAVGSSSTQASAKKTRGGSKRRSAATRLQALFRGRQARKRATWRKKYGAKRKLSKKAMLAKGRIARNRARALQILAEKAAAKMIKEKGLSVVNKKKLATIPGIVTRHLYRRYCTINPDSSTLWLGNNGQLVIDTQGAQGEPYVDKISHAPFYHFENWKNFVKPGDFSRFVELKALSNDPSSIDIETYQSKTHFNPLAGMGVAQRGIPPGASGGTTESLQGSPDMFHFDNGMDPHQNLVQHFGYNENKIEILPKIFHEDQLKKVIDSNNEDFNMGDPSRYADEWARCLPSRSTDSVKIKNFYIKFDFDTKFYGDEGERTNYIRALDKYSDSGLLLRGDFRSNSTSTQSAEDILDIYDKQGKRTVVSMNNRVPNMFAKIRVIIGKRKVFGKNQGERVALHNVLKTDDERVYNRFMSDEERLSDLFSRQNIRSRKKTYGTTHRTMDEDEYDDITIVKDEVITLGRGHTVKTFNVFKNQVLTYPSTEQNNGLIVDPIERVVGIPALGQPTNFDKYGYQSITDAEIASDKDEDKLKIPLENDMFMYVLNFTKGAAIRWRLTTKMSYHSC